MCIRDRTITHVLLLLLLLLLLADVIAVINTVNLIRRQRYAVQINVDSEGDRRQPSTRGRPPVVNLHYRRRHFCAATFHAAARYLIRQCFMPDQSSV